MSLRLLLQKPEFTLPSSLSAGSIILSDFDCPVILWLWIIGHYSRNYHYILLIRPGRNYSSETLKDLRAEPSYLLSSVALGHWWMRTAHAPSAVPTLCSRGSTIQTLDLGTVGWASPTAFLEGQGQQGQWHRRLTVSRVAPQVGSRSKPQAWADKGESYACLTCINFYSVSFPWWSKKYLLIIIDTFGKYQKKMR